MQVDKKIYLYDAIKIINEWLALGKPYYWKETPEFIIYHLKKLAENTPDNMIKYHDAVKVLNKAATIKLPGRANVGLEYFKQEWKKLYRG